MNKDKSVLFNEHAKYLAHIANAILNGKTKIFDVDGVKEIIALYLLIPYMSEETLETPDEECQIPKLKGNFTDGIPTDGFSISFSDLRNTIAHSVVMADNKKLFFDDRVKCKRKEHDKKEHHGDAVIIPINLAHNKLLEMASQIIE